MKKSITIRLLAFFMLIGGLCLVKAAPAQASVSGVTDLKQTGAAKNSITVSWTPAKDAVTYNVYYKEAGADSDYRLSGSTANPAYTLQGLQDGVKYYVQVKASDGTTESYGKTQIGRAHV